MNIFIKTIKNVLSQYLGDDEQQCICRDFELLVALSLDRSVVELHICKSEKNPKGGLFV